MRIIGFSVDWPKLKQPVFTTFRFERRDKDWQVGEIVNVKLKPRGKGGGVHKGYAQIVAKEPKEILNGGNITDAEAKEDGFTDKADMWRWLLKAHAPEQLVRQLNKLTLKYVEVF